MTRSTRCAGLSAAMIALLSVGACNRDPSTPEAKKARGEELMRKMSAQLAAAQSISLSATQTLEELRGGKLVPRTRTVTYAIRRPDKVHFVVSTSDGGSNEVWYDGAAGRITLAHHKEKMWARGPMPKTLDEALDALATEYGLNTPVADFFYSSPLDAFEQTGATGGWVAKETINGQVCHKLSYQNPVVDWDVWLSDGDRTLPCQLRILYKQAEGKPATTVVLKDWNLAAAFGDDRFKPKVDENAYARIYLMRAPTAAPEPEPAATPASSEDKK